MNIRKLSIRIEGYILLIFLSGFIISCRKSNIDPITHSSLSIATNNVKKPSFEFKEVRQWGEWYSRNIQNAPTLLFEKAESAVFKGQYFMRIPLEGSAGMIYFTKTNSLHAMFIREK